jgi:tetratricopeptide (TPR) repeat protein
MRRGSLILSAAVSVLACQCAPAGDIAAHVGASDSVRLCAAGDQLFRESRFEEAEAAYTAALEIDNRDVQAHLGLGRVAELLSDEDRARLHYSKAYQLNPLDPDAILAFASVVKEHAPREILWRNFLVLTKHDRARDAQAMEIAARLRIEEQVGDRTLSSLLSGYQPYRLPLSIFRPAGTAGGWVLAARINGAKTLRLVLDTGANGVVMNASAVRSLPLEPLTESVLAGFGSGAPIQSHVALANLFESGVLRIANLMVEVSETDIVRDADGVIGLNVFKDFLIHIDPRARAMDLTPFNSSGDDCDDCTRAYRLGNLLLMRGTINGHAQGYFILDTGSSYSLLSRDLVPREGSHSLVRGIQGEQDVKLPRLPVSIRLGEQQISDFRYATLDTNDLSSRHGVQIAGAIGYSPLGDFRLTIDYRNAWVKLERPGRR